MKDRKLTLRRETVTELASDELGRIAGASAGTCYTCILDCVTPKLIEVGPVPTLQHCFTHNSLVECITEELCQK